MRILYVLNSLGVGGAEKQVIALAEHMAVRGHSVFLVVLLPSHAGDFHASLPVAHLNLHKTPLSLAKAFRRYLHLLREFRPHLIHSHNFHGNMMARLARVIYPSAPVVSTIHNVYEGGVARMLAYRLTDLLCLQTTAVSSAVAERYICLRAVRAAKCIVLPNAIDIWEFAPNLARRDRLRAQFESSSDFIWLSVGRLVPAKDYPNLLRAFVTVREAHPDAQLWIAGDVFEHHLDSVTGVDHHENDVCWFGLRHDIPTLLDAADAFVLSSAWEGMPLALAEAMSMEKPFVATNVGGVRELAGDAGVLIPAKDPAALAAAMIQLMEQPLEVRQQMGVAARLRIASSFNMNTRAEQWESLYLDILKRSFAPRSLSNLYL